MLEAGGPGASMAVQAADPLEQDVRGTKIGEHQIRIEVQTLLHGLRRDRHTRRIR